MRIFDNHARQHTEEEIRELSIIEFLMHLYKDVKELVEVGLNNVKLLRGVEALHLSALYICRVSVVRVCNLSPDACLHFRIG